jgi:hypothetical protein
MPHFFSPSAINLNWLKAIVRLFVHGRLSVQWRTWLVAIWVVILGFELLLGIVLWEPEDRAWIPALMLFMICPLIQSPREEVLFVGLIVSFALVPAVAGRMDWFIDYRLSAAFAVMSFASLRPDHRLAPAGVLVLLLIVVGALLTDFPASAMKWRWAILAVDIFALLLLLTRRIVLSTALVIYAGLVLLHVARMKYTLLGAPLQVVDVMFVLVDPQGFFSLLRNYPQMAADVAMACAVLVLLIAYGRSRELPILRFASPAVRGVLGLALLAGSGYELRAMADAWVDEGAIARAQGLERSEALDRWMRDPLSAPKTLSLMVTGEDIGVRLPARIPNNRFTALSLETQSGKRRPHILMILQESIFDVRRIPFCQGLPCTGSMFDNSHASIQSEQGPLLVHTFGGGTMLSEFAFLTGLDWRLFGPAGAYPPYQLAPRLNNSLARRLRELGYRTVALVPTKANYLHGRQTYLGNYGFEEFYAVENMGLQDLGWKIPDWLLFQQALRLVDGRADDRPLFIFLLTISNHGPHGGAGWAPSERWAAAGNAEVADYLTRLEQTEADFEQLSYTWLQRPGDRLIGWFGDHQPFLASRFWPVAPPHQAIGARQRYGQDAFWTYFQFRANYGAGRSSTQDRPVDIARLGSRMWALAGLPEDRQAVADRKLSNVCGGMFLTCESSHAVSEYVSYRLYDLKEWH